MSTAKPAGAQKTPAPTPTAAPKAAETPTPTAAPEAVSTPSKQEIAPAAAVAPPKHAVVHVDGVEYDYGQDAGAGMDLANVGGRLPFLSLLQGQSKAVQAGGAAYIEGATPGQLCISNLKRVFKGGAAGPVFVPIHEERKFNEYEKKAGEDQAKFIAQHDPDSQVVKATRASAPNFKDQRTPDGHELREVFQVYGVIVDELPAQFSMDDIVATLNNPARLVPCVIGFSMTNLKARRSFMDRLRMFSAAVPLYACVLRLNTKLVQQDKRSFYNFDPVFAVQDDVKKSLVPPRHAGWNTWAAFCRKMIERAKEGALTADSSGHAEQAPSSASDGDADVPF